MVNTWHESTDARESVGTEPRVPPVEWKVPPTLRSFGIRAKILAVLALPVVVLSLAAGVIATAGIGESRKATQVEGSCVSLPG